VYQERCDVLIISVVVVVVVAAAAAVSYIPLKITGLD
jgi:hypothetical protein